MRKRVLVLASTFPKSVTDLQPEFVKLLSQRLCVDYDVTVLVPHAPGAKVREKVGDLDVVRYRYIFERFETLAYGSGILSNLKQSPVKWLLVPFFFMGQLLSIYRLTKNVRYDVIHAHWIIPQGVAITMLKLFVRKLPPIVITSHGGDLYALKSNTGKVLKKWVLARANAITVVSSAMKEYCIQELAIEPSKVQVLSMGVDLKSTFIPNSSLVRENKNIIFVGRMVEKKGVKYLIKAMPSVLAAEPNAKLTLIGDGLLRGRIESDVKELGLEDSVTLLGAVSNQLIPDYLSASAIAVVPSIIDSNGDQEGLGLVAVEAMGCGCAVVVSDLPALRDVVKNGETGMMVEPQCPEDIANKLVYLLSNQSRCREIADNGRRFVITKFDWDDVAAKYRVVLNAAMGFEAGLEG